MLDLGLKFGTKTYDIKLFSGEVLHLLRPTKKMMMDIQYLSRDKDTDTDTETVLSMLYELLSTLLSNNVEGRKFTPQELEQEIDFAVAVYVIQDYFNSWTQSINNVVNFPITQ